MSSVWCLLAYLVLLISFHLWLTIQPYCANIIWDAEWLSAISILLRNIQSVTVLFRAWQLLRFTFDICFPLLCNQWQWQSLGHFRDIRSDLAVIIKTYYNETKSEWFWYPRYHHSGTCLVLLSPPWSGQLSRGFILCKYHRINSLQPAKVYHWKFTVFVQTFLFFTRDYF